MPAPRADEMKEIARATFASYAITLPVLYIPPAEGPAGEEIDTPLPTHALFRAAANTAHHHEVVMANTDVYGGFIDAMAECIADAWGEWHREAVLAEVDVDAAGKASGGRVEAPAWKALILTTGPSGSKSQKAYTRAVGTAIGEAWAAFESTLAVPGLPWFAGAQGSDVVENEAVPLSLLGGRTGLIDVPALEARMTGVLGNPNAPHAVPLFTSIADAFVQTFEPWRRDTTVTRVMWRPGDPKAQMEPGGFC